MAESCGWCGEALTSEEIETPAQDGLGNEIAGICDDCFHEHYEWTCDRCGEYEYEEFQGIWFVVFEDGWEVPRGIYEVIGWPYYRSSCIGRPSLNADQLCLVRSEIDFEQDDDYPCGHLCRECAKKLKLRHSKRGREFHRERLGKREYPR